MAYLRPTVVVVRTVLLCASQLETRPLKWARGASRKPKDRLSCRSWEQSSHTSAQTHSSKPASLLCYSIVETNQFFYLSHKMSEWDAPKVDLDHPDSAIRLASAVHRFKVPKMNEDRKLSFARR